MHHNVPTLFNLRVLLSSSLGLSPPVTQRPPYPLWNAFFSCLPGYHTHLFAFYLTSYCLFCYFLSISLTSKFWLATVFGPQNSSLSFFMMNFYRTYLLTGENSQIDKAVKMTFLNSGPRYPTTYLMSPLGFLNSPFQVTTCSNLMPSFSTNLFLPQFSHFQ